MYSTFDFFYYRWGYILSFCFVSVNRTTPEDPITEVAITFGRCKISGVC